MPTRLNELHRPFLAAVRRLRRRPAFSALALSLLTLGIASLLAIFAIVNAAILRPLPYRDPGALYALVSTEPAGDSTSNMALGYYQFVKWRSENRLFDALEGYTPVTMKLLGEGNPEPLDGFMVSAGFFDVLGWRPFLGSTFSRDQEVTGSPSLVISHSLWQRRFGGDPDIIGKVVNVDDAPRTIIGVMPKEFSMLYQPADAWLPLPLEPALQVRKARFIAGVARLKPGATLEQGISDLGVVNQSLAMERPDEHRNTGVSMTPLRELLFGRQKTTLLVLLGAGVVLWAVALVNVLSLTFGDAIARRTATMTHLALGAQPRDIIRSRIAEMALLSTVACAISLALVGWGLPMLYNIAPDLLASIRDVTFDWLVVVIAVALAAAATIVCGVPAAIGEASVSFSGLAGSDVKAVGGRRDRKARSLLLTAQVALAVVLLVGASLLARNLSVLLSKPLGFSTENVTVVELTFSRTKYTTTPARALYAQQLIDAIHAIPEVSAVATIQTRFVANESMLTLFEIEGKPVAPGTQSFVNIRHVTPEVARVLDLRLHRGRMFSPADREGSLPVAIVSRSFAQRHWGNADPIGARIRRIVTAEAPWMEVIGVVDDIRDSGVGVEAAPTLFVSYLQQNTAMARPTIVIRSTANATQLFPAVRRAIWSVDPTQTIDAMSWLDDLMLRTASQPRFAAIVGGLLAVSALVLVLAGIYAVTLHDVLGRTKEIGVRTALGASNQALIWAVMRQGLVPAAAGIVAGLLTAVPAAGAMQGILADGLSWADVPSVLGVIALICAAIAVASFIPARRALAVSPMIAMRQ